MPTRAVSAPRADGKSPLHRQRRAARVGRLIGSAEKPVKVLGQGDVAQKLFVAADKFSSSARRKIEDAGGFVQVLAPEAPEARSPEAEESTEQKPADTKRTRAKAKASRAGSRARGTDRGGEESPVRSRRPKKTLPRRTRNSLSLRVIRPRGNRGDTGSVRRGRDDDRLSHCSACAAAAPRSASSG